MAANPCSTAYATNFRLGVKLPPPLLSYILRKMIDELWPPKPNVLLNALRISRF